MAGMTGLRAALARASRPFIIVLCLVLTAVCGVLDYETGTELSFSVFYLFPIYLATWHGGRWTGLAIASVSAAVWLGADLLGGHVYTSRLIPYWNMAVRLAFFLITSHLLWRLSDMLRTERGLARTDAVTGIANARQFFEQASLEIERAERSGTAFTCVFLDVDDFKAVNDRFGHAVGDALLVEVARTLLGTIRKTDTAGRLGGDEFALLLAGADRKSAAEIVGRVQARLRSRVAERGWPVTFSIGSVTFHRPPDSVQEMLRIADELMYSAKRSGKDSALFSAYGDSRPA